MPLWDVTAGSATTEGSPALLAASVMYLLHINQKVYKSWGRHDHFHIFHILSHFTPAWRAKQWLEPRKTCSPLKHTQLC